MEQTAAIFERTAVHDHPADRPLSKSESVRIADTLAFIPPGLQTALDVGCGPGVLLERLPVARAYGTDLGRRGLRHVRRPAVRSSIFALPFRDAAFDLVTCTEVLEHLDPAEVPAAVAELYRVAARHVLITVPHAEQLLESSHRCPRCGEVFHLHGHRQSLTEGTLRPLFPPEAKISVRYSWRVRPWSENLLRFRTHTLNLWKYSPHGFCPKCGFAELQNHERRLLYRLTTGLNELRHPRRTKWNWLLMRIDKPTAGGTHV
ncbi:MAG: class I SAM-dependent methyltransferase [Myxococcales bacterium]|nr:class I SAM-dependent methyltransferase [Myxococcales bacterium]